MTRWIVLSLLLVGFAAPALAQRPVAVPEPAAVRAADGPRILHITDQLDRRPEAVAALEAFHRARQAGKFTQACEARTYTVGQTQTFKVLTDLVTSPTWTTEAFTLQATSDVANVWVADAELSNGNVPPATVDALEEAMIERTPAGSFDPGAGIIANDNAVFGDPPNVDGDCRVDVLLYDIEEGTDNGTFIAGYVTSSDLGPSGNNADVLHLDTNPGLTGQPIEAILSTAAHEYQHLIHYAYDLDEETFVNEGLSEWAERMNGYSGRRVTYLGSGSEQGLSLFTWRSGADVLRDYERAGLWTTYLAEQTDALTTGAVTRDNTNGLLGYRDVLGLDNAGIRDVILDFHTANLVNDPALLSDARFSYAHAGLQALRASVPADRVVDGRTVTQTTDREVTVNGGAAYYAVWENVSDLRLTLDVVAKSGQTRTSLLDKARARLVLEQGGTATLRELTFQADEQVVVGDYDRVRLVLVNAVPLSSGLIGDTRLDRVAFRYGASWAGETVEEQLVQYDDGLAVSGKFFTLFSDANGALATRFAVPQGTSVVLDRVSIAPYYLSQFSEDPNADAEPRDLALKIWADDGGDPGAELFSLTMDDPRPFAPITSFDLPFFDVDLSDYADELDALPAVIHIGYAEAGTDDNYFVAGVSAYEDEDLSHVGDVSVPEWAALWSIQFEGGDPDPLVGTVLPVRARFLLGDRDVAVEDAGELPEAVALEQNYPNPFNPVTTIRYRLDRTAPVRLAVYDVLGREVAVLVDGLQPAGAQEVQVDASAWASGVYLYTLQTADRTVTRTMQLIK